MNSEKQTRWLWYPGDFEIRQGLLQNFSREERGYDWPAYWNVDDCHKNVKFKRYYELTEPTSFIVYATGIGYVEVNGKKYPLKETINCQPGKNKIRIFVGNATGLPAVFVEGEVIKSDVGWRASNFIEELPAGWSSLYLDKANDPNHVYFEKKVVTPVSINEQNDGVLIDYGRAVYGTLAIKKMTHGQPIMICYGESVSEALDVEMCYYKEKAATVETIPRKRAFRYLFVPDVAKEEIEIEAIHESLPLTNHAAFSSDNVLLNKIWEVSVETFTLCSGLFFIDGIKRDRWIWSGDAYQSYFINQYLFFDEEINTRTMLALRGQNEIKQHMNTIVDYSILWIIAVENHYLMTGDTVFLKQIYPKMKTMMDYLQAQTNELGFIYGREKDVASQVWMVLAEVFDQPMNREILETMIAHHFPITGIATPYMYHHVVEALFVAGLQEEAIQLMKNYWGKMIQLGADTFWEAFKPEEPDFSPYGSPIISSYCHAWSCTPAYLIEKYLN